MFLAVASVYWMTRFSPVIPVVSVGLFMMCLLAALFMGRRIDASSMRFASGLFVLNLIWFLSSLWFDPVRVGAGEIAKSAVQNAFYIMLAPLVVSILPKVDRGKVVVRTSFLVIAVLLGLCMLERAGMLHLDALQQTLYSNGMLYENYARDRLLVGFVRPKLVASEPSLVASLMATIAIVARSFGASRWSLLVISIAAWLAIGSPYAFLPLLVALLPRAQPSSRLAGSLPVVAGAVLLAYVVLVSIVLLSDGNLPLRDESDYRRLILPIELAMEAVRQNPLTGFGMASWDHLGEADGPVSSGVFMPFVAVHQGGVVGLLMMTLIVRRYLSCLGLVFGGAVILILSVVLGSTYGSSLFYIIVLERVFRMAAESKAMHEARSAPEDQLAVDSNAHVPA